MKAFGLIKAGLALVTFMVMTMTANANNAGSLDGFHGETTYVSGIGKYIIDVKREADGGLTAVFMHDPNQCFYDRLGNPTGCTRIRVSRDVVALKVVPTPTDRRTLVYSLEGTEYELVTTVGPQARCGGGNLHVRLLKKAEDGEVILALPM